MRVHKSCARECRHDCAEKIVRAKGGTVNTPRRGRLLLLSSWLHSLHGLFTKKSFARKQLLLLLLCGELGVRQVVRLLVAHDGVRGPRAFEVGQVHSGGNCRRNRGSRSRGQEGGLEVTVREEETWREVGHERGDYERRREKARSVSTHGKCTQRKKLD